MRKKKNRKSSLKKFTEIVKRSSDAERRKSEEKKRKKQNKPKGMRARRMGMFVFWSLFLFMFLVTVINVFGGSSSIQDDEFIQERTKLLDNEALEFSKSFVHDYFNWGTGKHGKDDLEMRISPYLLGDLDSFGGIRYNDEWSSNLDKRDIELKDIQEIDDSKARYIFKVKLTMKSKTDEKDSKIDEEKISFDELLEERNKVQIKNGYKTKELIKYISIPVYYNKELDRFAVFELPSFTFVEEGKMEDTLKNNLSKLQVLSDNYTENNVNSFLSTFFESYSKDSKDKLSYILEDEKHEYGLGGTMEFSEINESTIYIIDDNHDRFLVEIEVEMIEPTTKYKFDNKFLVVVKRKDQRYVVESLNDEKYVFDLVDNYLEQFEDDESRAEDDSNVEENNEYEYQSGQSEENDEESDDNIDLDDKNSTEIESEVGEDDDE